MSPFDATKNGVVIRREKKPWVGFVECAYVLMFDAHLEKGTVQGCEITREKKVIFSLVREINGLGMLPFFCRSFSVKIQIVDSL